MDIFKNVLGALALMAVWIAGFALIIAASYLAILLLAMLLTFIPSAIGAVISILIWVAVIATLFYAAYNIVSDWRKKRKNVQ